MTREPLTVVAGIYVRKGRVLLARRPLSGDLPGLWEFPGGKVENGETPSQALRREWREELGVTPLGPLPYRFVEARSPAGIALTLLFFRVRGLIGEPSPLGCEAVRWSLPAEASLLAVAGPDRPILDALPRTGDTFDETEDDETPELARGEVERDPYIVGSEFQEGDENVSIRFTKADEEGRRFEGILVRTESGTKAYVNRCPHVPIPLDREEGEFLAPDGRHLVCHTHGALFSSETGLCVSGPCKGDSLRPLPIEKDGSGWRVSAR